MSPAEAAPAVAGPQPGTLGGVERLTARVYRVPTEAPEADGTYASIRPRLCSTPAGRTTRCPPPCATSGAPASPPPRSPPLTWRCGTWPPGRMVAADAVDCLQIDVSRCGGVTEWLRVAAVAAAHNFEVSAHCAPHLHACVALVTPNLRHVEWFHDHVRVESMLFDGTVPATGGAMRPDLSAPGHGLTLRELDAEQYRLA